MDARVIELHCIMPMANIPSVLRVGILSNEAAAQFEHESMALEEAQEKRDARQVPRGLWLHRDVGGAMIVNFPTKGHWRSASRLADIESGLDFFTAHAREWGICSVAFPPLGCGNGGLEWKDARTPRA